MFVVKHFKILFFVIQQKQNIKKPYHNFPHIYYRYSISHIWVKMKQQHILEKHGSSKRIPNPIWKKPFVIFHQKKKNLFPLFIYLYEWDMMAHEISAQYFFIIRYFFLRHTIYDKWLFAEWYVLTVHKYH